MFYKNTLFLLVFVIVFDQDLNTIYKDWEKFAPQFLDFYYTQPKKLHLITVKNITKFYMGEEKIDQNLNKFRRIFTDRIFRVDAETAVKMQANVTKSPVFYLWFCYAGDNNEAKSKRFVESI